MEAVEEEVEVEEVEAVEAEAEAAVAQEHPFNPLIKETSENKERCPRSSMEIVPRRKNSSKTYEVTTA